MHANLRLTLIIVILSLLSSVSGISFLLDAEDLSQHLTNHKYHGGSLRLKRDADLHDDDDLESLYIQKRAVPEESDSGSQEFLFATPPTMRPYDGGLEDEEKEQVAPEAVLQGLNDESSLQEEQVQQESKSRTRRGLTDSNDPVLGLIMQGLKAKREALVGQRRAPRRRLQRRQLLDIDVYPKNRKFFKYFNFPKHGLFHRLFRVETSKISKPQVPQA